MQIFPVQLDSYFFPVVSVIANHEFDPTSETIVYPEINTKVNVSANKDNENLYQVRLDLTIAPSNDEQIPYKVKLAAVGFFEVSPEVSDKQTAVYVNGAGILYSASREFLLNIMGRGPWPPVLLPITYFTSNDPCTTPTSPPPLTDE